ncbi:MAG: amidohydrolase [Deltaproteobacteria bacterium]|nr:amidohydrolase [Deltaproteobacteria bacterium]
MIAGTTIIDADGHIMDWDDVVRPYMPEPYRRRALFYPLENWDRDLGGTLGKHWVRDLDTRLADMDRQQIDVSVLYPTVGLMLGRVREPEFAAALCRAYNDFVAEVCRQSPRLKAVAMVPLQNIPAAVSELRRAVQELGLVGVMLPAHGHGENLGNPEFHPLYAEAEKLVCPVAIHANGGVGGADVDAQAFDQFICVHTVGHPFPQMFQLTGIVFGGVPELFPRLRLAFLEAGAGWVPYWMDRMDREYKLRAVEAPLLRAKPSEYIRSGRLYFSCEADETTLPAVLQAVGEDVVLYASDYPHWDMDYPDSGRELWERTDLSPHARRKILGENARRLYHL